VNKEDIGYIFNNVETKEGIAVKRLIAELLILAYEDLKLLIKNPEKCKKYLLRYNDSPERLLYFWQNDAPILLSFLVGKTKTQKIIQKILVLL